MLKNGGNNKLSGNIAGLKMDMCKGKVLEFNIQTDYFGETPPCGRSCISGALILIQQKSDVRDLVQTPHYKHITQLWTQPCISSCCDLHYNSDYFISAYTFSLLMVHNLLLP